MKVGIFTDTYLPDLNGVATSSYTLAKALVNHGHEVLIITTDLKKGEQYEDEFDVYRMSGIELKNLYDYRLSNIFSAIAMKKIMNFHLDIIHIQTEFSVGIFGKIVAHLLNIPLVYTYHTQYEDYVHYAPVIGKVDSMQPLLKKAVEKISQLYGDDCTELIAPSIKTRDILKGYGIDKEISVIPTGLELDRFEETALDKDHLAMVKQECRIDDGCFHLIFLGRIAPEKSIDYLIRALTYLDDKVKLLIVGGGPGIDELKQLATSLGVMSQVLFLGPKSKEEVPYYYHVCDAFASASVSETQGLTYIEALSAKLPVLARYDQPLEDIIEEGKNGFFFNNEKELAELVLKLRTMDLSEMKANSYASSRRFGIDHFYEHIIEVYEKAIVDKHYTYKISSMVSLPNQMVEVGFKLHNHTISLRLPEMYILKHPVELGQVIEHQQFKMMQDYEQVYKGYKKALRYLSVKDYTKKQMYDKLAKSEDLSKEQLETLMKLLEERKLINDEAYASEYISQQLNHGHGVRKSLLKLKSKGIDAQVIDDTDPEQYLDQEVAKATTLALKLFENNRSKSYEALRRHIKQYLFNHGFSSKAIIEALNALPTAMDDEDEWAYLEREYEKIFPRYEKKYDGYELKQHLYQYLMRKGYEASMISQFLDDMEESRGGLDD